MAETGDTSIWSSGEAYEAYVGRWSRLVTHEFVKWLSPAPHALWLDVGCGTGALARTVLETSSPRGVIGVDHSEPFVKYVTSRLAPHGFYGSVQDARRLGLVQASCHYAVSGLALNFVPEPQQAVREMARVTKAGGCVAAYIWDYAEMQLMQHFWDAARQLDPAARALDESVRFETWKSDRLEELFRDAQLQDVETNVIDVLTVFRNFEDYWTPFLGGQGPAPAYAASLSEEQRLELGDRVRANLTMADDGSIHLNARALAVRGTR